MDRHTEQFVHKLANCHTKRQLFRAIVDSPFEYPIEAAELYLGIIVLLLANKKTGMIDRVALSNTELAKGTTDVSVKRFEDIRIPLNYADNLVAQVIRTGHAEGTADWQYLFAPVLTPEEARLNQAAGAIAYSAVYPLPGAAGALIFSYYQYPEKIGAKQKSFMNAYSNLVDQRLGEFFDALGRSAGV
jgi:hypothetical protein